MVYGFSANQPLITPYQSFDSQAFLDESSHVTKPEQTAPSSPPQSSDSSSSSFFSFDLLGNGRHQLSTNPSAERPESFATKSRITLLVPSSSTREEIVATTGEIEETSESDDDMDRESQLEELAIKMRVAADSGIAFSSGRRRELNKTSSSERGESVSTTERQVKTFGSDTNETIRANQLAQLTGNMKLAAEEGTAFTYGRHRVIQGSPIG